MAQPWRRLEGQHLQEKQVQGPQNQVGRLAHIGYRGSLCPLPSVIKGYGDSGRKFWIGAGARPHDTDEFVFVEGRGGKSARRTPTVFWIPRAISLGLGALRRGSGSAPDQLFLPVPDVEHEGASLAVLRSRVFEVVPGPEEKFRLLGLLEGVLAQDSGVVHLVRQVDVGLAFPVSSRPFLDRAAATSWRTLRSMNCESTIASPGGIFGAASSSQAQVFRPAKFAAWS